MIGITHSLLKLLHYFSFLHNYSVFGKLLNLVNIVWDTHVAINACTRVRAHTQMFMHLDPFVLIHVLHVDNW